MKTKMNKVMMFALFMLSVFFLNVHDDILGLMGRKVVFLLSQLSKVLRNAFLLASFSLW